MPFLSRQILYEHSIFIYIRHQVLLVVRINTCAFLAPPEFCTNIVRLYVSTAKKQYLPAVTPKILSGHLRIGHAGGLQRADKASDIEPGCGSGQPQRRIPDQN